MPSAVAAKFKARQGAVHGERDRVGVALAQVRPTNQEGAFAGLGDEDALRSGKDCGMEELTPILTHLEIHRIIKAHTAQQRFHTHRVVAMLHNLECVWDIDATGLWRVGRTIVSSDKHTCFCKAVAPGDIVQTDPV